MKNFNDYITDDTLSGDVATYPKPFIQQKKKKKVYDGRTKEGRKFIERMLANRAKRQAKKLAEKDDS